MSTETPDVIIPPAPTPDVSAPTPHPFLEDQKEPIDLPVDERPMRIGSADAVLAKPCPVCGNSMSGNRCDVDGYQLADT